MTAMRGMAASVGRRDVRGWLGLIALCAAFFGLSTRWLGFYAWGVDEGMYLMRARMMGDGFVLYRDIWFNQPPLLVLLIRAMFDAGAESVEAARLVPLALATLGVGATAVLARALGGWRAAFAAAVLLIVSPMHFSLARAVMATQPALSLAMASLALMVGYRAATRSGRRRWATAALAASGLAFGLGLTVKFIALPWLVPLVLLALDGHIVTGAWRAPRAWPWRRIAADALVWVAATAVPIAAVLRTYGLAALFAQTVSSLAAARDELGFDLTANVGKLLEAIIEGQLAVTALGVFGLGRGDAHEDRRRLWRIVAAWLAVGLAAVLLHAPVWSHHFMLLFYPLAVAGGCGLVDLVGLGHRTWLVRRAGDRDAALEGRDGDGAGWRAFAVTVVGAVLLSMPIQVKRVTDSTDGWDGDAGDAIARLGAVMRPGDYLITDSPMIAFRAGMRVPPDMCDPGKKRIDGGELTMDNVMADIDRFKPSAVLFWEGRLSHGPFNGFPAAIEAEGFERLVEFDVREERWLYGR